jgi:hypothetical protein
VRTFSQQGTLTLGGNVSIAAGPVGRNAEAAGAASVKGVAGVFSYSKTRGLFAGVSLEGSAIIERRDANEKLYGQRFTAAQLLGGAVRPPPATGALMDILNSRIFNGGGMRDDSIYNDIPVYDNQHDDVVWEGRRGSALGEGVRRDRGSSMNEPSSPYGYGGARRATTWADDIYDRTPTGGTAGAGRGRFDDDYHYSDSPTSPAKKVGPGRPAGPKPAFGSKADNLKSNQAVALFTFDADQPGDLGFKKGDVITVTKKTDSSNDWW